MASGNPSPQLTRGGAGRGGASPRESARPKVRASQAATLASSLLRNGNDDCSILDMTAGMIVSPQDL
jgi:hypothetical protein